MKVLKNNYSNNIVEQTKSYPREVLCEHCGSELEYEKSDLKIGSFGCAYVDCPLCHHQTFIDDENSLTLTRDNIEFPTHFFHTSKETGAVDCCNNEEVKKYIHKAINYFRENKDEFYWFAATGNLNVSVTRYSGDGCYEVVVTKDYYETSIPFEEEDY